MKSEKYHRKTEAGHSLIEMIMAMSISLIGLIGGLTLYRSAHHTVNAGRESTEIQARGRKVLELMAMELQESNVDTIDLSATGAISFASARSGGTFATEADGSPDWNKAVVYCVDSDSNCLRRYDEAKTDWPTLFNTSYFLTRSDLDTVCEDVVEGVIDMTCQLVGSVLTIAVKMKSHMEPQMVSPQASEELSEPYELFTMDIYLRN